MTLTEKALTIATEKQEQAWQRLCTAVSEGAKKHWTNTYEKYAGLVVKLTRRLNG
jgi:hypothetical protein